MDAEMAVNLFSDQFYGRLLAELQHSDGQSLPNIPIADLGDLDINIPQPQNGGLHWATNNNNNEVSPAGADNSWGDPRQQCDSGMKRQLDISSDQHDHHDGGQRGTKFMRMTSDVTPFNSTGDASLIMVNRDTNLGLINSLDDRNIGEIRHSSRNYPASVATIEDTPTTTLMGYNIQEGFSSARRVRNSVDSYDGSTESPEGDGKIQDFHSISIDSSPAAGIGVTDSCYQQVQISPATADNRECDGKLDLQSADPDSRRSERQQHPTKQSKFNATKTTNDPKEEKTSIQGFQGKSDETSGQTFLDWAMENGLLESENESIEKVSSTETIHQKSQFDFSNDVTKTTLNQGEGGVTDKVHILSEKGHQNVHSAIFPHTIHLQMCTLCHLRFRKNEHLLSHLKQCHPNENFYQCPDCAAKLEDLQLLEDHMKVHSLISNISADDAQSPETSDDDYTGCEICQAVFPSEEALLQHHSTYHSHKSYAESRELSLPFAHNLNARLESDSALFSTMEFNESPSTPTAATEDTNSSSNNDLNDQAAKATILSTKAANTTNSAFFNSTNSHLYSEQDFLHLNFKREYSDEQPDKELCVPGIQTQNEKSQAENFINDPSTLDLECSNGYSLHTQTKDHKNCSDFNLSEDSCNKAPGISTSSTPETDTDQTESSSKLCMKNNEKNTEQPKEAGQKVIVVSADTTRKETIPVRNQFNDNCPDQNGVVFLSDKQDSCEHDDNELVLLCKIDTAVSKVEFSSIIQDAETDVWETKTDSACVSGDNATDFHTPEQSASSAFDDTKDVHVYEVTCNYTEEDSKDVNDATCSLNVESTNISVPLILPEYVTPTNDVLDIENSQNLQKAQCALAAEDIPTKSEINDCTTQETSTNLTLNDIKRDTNEDKTSLVQNWVQLTESKTVIPPHMPNYTTYKCLTCAISFMSEAVLKRHCEAHLKPKKRVKKKRSKGKKTKKRKSSDPDAMVTTGEVVDVFRTGTDPNQNGQKDGNPIRPVIVSYDESDNEENAEEVKKNPQVVDGSLLSRHVKLFQEYL